MPESSFTKVTLKITYLKFPRSQWVNPCCAEFILGNFFYCSATLRWCRSLNSWPRKISIFTIHTINIMAPDGLPTQEARSSIAIIYRDSPTVWCLCALFLILPQFYIPFYVKKTKMDNFMCLLEFECAKRLRTHSEATLDMDIGIRQCVATDSTTMYGEIWE